MEFKTFFSMMKKRLSDGADVPYFFRDLVAMITDVTEDEWGTPKDPSTKLSKESTLRSYAKRGISKKFAESIVYRLTPENFIESLNDDHRKGARKLLAEDYKIYDEETDEDNVAEKLAYCFVDIIRESAGMIPADELEQQKQQQLAVTLKREYGNYLLNEESHYCPFPGCGRRLTISNGGKTIDSYEVSLIDKNKTPEIHNLLALCPRCYATYLLDDNKKICKELMGIKSTLETYAQCVNLADDLPLEKGISAVILKIKKLKEQDLVDASLNPKEIKEKLRPSDNYVLYNTVKSYVTTYYVRIREIMINLDKRGEIDYEEVQDQMRAIYKRLKKSKKTNMEIFNTIVDKVHHVSLQEDVYCQIVVAYFIQNCEVFDAVTK